jgi:hypothetical protein
VKKMAKLPKVSEKNTKKWKSLKEKWIAKLGVTDEKLDEQVVEIFKEIKEENADKPVDRLFRDSMRKLYIKYKKQLASPAVSFDFFLVSVGEKVDTVAKRRREAFAEYEKNRDKALFSEANSTGVVIEAYKEDYEANDALKEYKDLAKKGVIHKAPKKTGEKDDDGEDIYKDVEFAVVPIDNREKTKAGKDNRWFGRPLALKSWMRVLVGVGMRQGEEDPKEMVITLNDELAQEVPPSWQFLSARFNWYASDEEKDNPELVERYKLGGSRATKFTSAEVDRDDFDEIIRDSVPNLYQELDELESWHDEQDKDSQRFCITEGDVTALFLEPNKSGSRRLVIDDIDLGFGDDDDELERGVTVWVPQHVDIDFGEESRIIVAGRVGRSRSRDEITGEYGDEYDGQIQIGATGLWAIPEYKVEILAEEVTEDEVIDEEEHNWEE